MRFTIRLCTSSVSTGSVTKKLKELTKQYANLPDSYIQRASEMIEFKTPARIEYRQVTREPFYYRYTSNRPWTEEWKRQNEAMRKFVLVEPIKEWTIFRGDRVEILVGRDRGKQGLVNQVIQERNWVYVAGLNAHHRRVGANTPGSPGVVLKSEAPLLVTNQVALVDPSDKRITKVEWRYTEDGEKVRVSLRTGRILPIPPSAFETKDYKDKSSYLEGDKDTKAAEVKAITFNPTLKTFEMEIMDSLGIIEERIPKKTYWY